MISSIKIANVASYGTEPQVLDKLAQFNFLYGANGTGKTTISRIISDRSQFPTCNVIWQGGTELQTFVYNRDFIEKNFSQSTKLKGIFTLGEKSIETQTKIAAAMAKVDELTARIEQLTGTLQGQDGKGGKRGVLADLMEDLRDRCWKEKQYHDAKFSRAFEGYRKSAEKFRDKILVEKAQNSALLQQLSDLERKAETVFGPAPAQETAIKPLTNADLLALESDPILNKPVVGKADVDIAAMIQRLGNSDWVKQGRAYYAVNDKRCPFCQQSTPDSLEKSLNEYFDETFEKDTKAIERVESDYTKHAEGIHNHLNSILSAASKFLEVEKLDAQRKVLNSKIALNLQRIAGKRKEPSQKVGLEALGDAYAAANRLIEEANSRISEHNKMVSNLAKEQSTLTAEVWKYLVGDQLKSYLSDFEKKQADLDKAIASLSDQIKSAQDEKAAKELEIRELEKTTTSIEPTINEINAVLLSFGFVGFSLATAEDGKSYKLVRPSGVNAKETLSEGEQSFVTFLYFYNLLRGSQSESGIVTNRVVVFDDPVSSLDSAILFVVSGLVKGLCDDVRTGKGTIKQIFVLTHNVYFHKQVTFNAKRGDEALKEETFWIVRKQGLTSKVEKHNSNPVKTNYEMLWAEVRSPNPSKQTIQNIMRRILEHYFTILGRTNTDDICKQFKGNEYLMCRSLFSWVNAGSHSVQEDAEISIDDTAVQGYLQVFKGIFEKSGHLPHYEMMMRGTGVEIPTDGLAS